MLLTLHSLLVLSASQDFDFFYFVQQWPGSYCDTKHGCCYPRTGKPASDFGIHGLWPNRNDGSYPSNCDSSNPFDASKDHKILRPNHIPPSELIPHIMLSPYELFPPREIVDYQPIHNHFRHYAL
ncbi:hypothetical protein L1987_61942 [Smallanthus sonchifolius]|uniref:Uncharacterized protein n=1 Tax=Smallanthus sonchifolius TaxID=185202 RepID=A0ACB9C945_9ASTR|nr:hypothetical protein L1987_61942 [Smallanthus sonchifolius]